MLVKQEQVILVLIHWTQRSALFLALCIQPVESAAGTSVLWPGMLGALPRGGYTRGILYANMHAKWAIIILDAWETSGWISEPCSTLNGWGRGSGSILLTVKAWAHHWQLSFPPVLGGHAVSCQCFLDRFNMAQCATKKTICCAAHCQCAHSEQVDLKIGSVCITSMLSSKWTEWTELPHYLCLPPSTTQGTISPNSDIQCTFPFVERWMFSLYWHVRIMPLPQRLVLHWSNDTHPVLNVSKTNRQPCSERHVAHFDSAAK